MIDMEELKDQLLTFIDLMGEPLDADSIYRHCIQPIDRYRIYDALHQLEDEGKIMRLSDGRYVTARAALRRWIKGRLVDVGIPEEVVREAERAMGQGRKKYRTVDSFISEALKEYIERVWRAWSEGVK